MIEYAAEIFRKESAETAMRRPFFIPYPAHGKRIGQVL
jgi:hypothetical protein